jgi:hypothetical protein
MCRDVFATEVRARAAAEVAAAKVAAFAGFAAAGVQVALTL